jgi:phage tail-like protein
MPGSQRTDPYAGFRFLVEVEGLVVGGFSEVTGLEAEIETEEYREGGVNDYVHNLPKGTKYPAVVLKRGVADSDTLWKWHNKTRDGQIEFHTVHLILLDDQGNHKWDWRFNNACPVKWSVADFKADSSAVAIESLELSHKGIRSNKD